MSFTGIKENESGKHYYLNGKLHREDGPAVEYANGDKLYYLNGKCHREDGPAIERANGDKAYYLNKKLHREDGPAIEYTDGSKYYYLNGKCLSEKEYFKWMVKKYKLDDKMRFLYYVRGVDEFLEEFRRERRFIRIN